MGGLRSVGLHRGSILHDLGLPERGEGFTLIELVMTMILIGTLAVIATPKIDNEPFYLRRAAYDLVAALRYAQQQSMNQSGATHFEVVISSSGFTVQRSGGSGVANPQGGGSYTHKSDAWSGITLSASGTIRFDSRGKPICSGSYSACSEADASAVLLTLTRHSTTTQLRIEPFTGYAHLL